jgi:hypothetical protein
MPSPNARTRASARSRARRSAQESARARAAARSRSRARATLDDDARSMPLIRPLARRSVAPGALQVWLEVQGQQRLLRLHSALKLRRQLLDRWSTLLDDADDRVTRRLELLGGDSLGYDTRLADNDDGENYGDLEDAGPGHRPSRQDEERRTASKASAPRASSRSRSSTRRTPAKKSAAKKQSARKR